MVVTEGSKFLNDGVPYTNIFVGKVVEPLAGRFVDVENAYCQHQPLIGVTYDDSKLVMLKLPRRMDHH